MHRVEGAAPELCGLLSPPFLPEAKSYVMVLILLCCDSSIVFSRISLVRIKQSQHGTNAAISILYF